MDVLQESMCMGWTIWSVDSSTGKWWNFRKSELLECLMLLKLHTQEGLWNPTQPLPLFPGSCEYTLLPWAALAKDPNQGGYLILGLNFQNTEPK
jgi:hypothetical protein